MGIVLIGYMGSGKSTIAKALAKNTGYTFIDLDDYIEKQEQKSVATIFKQHGELHFRALEKQALEHLLQQKEPMVLSLGGGTPCYYDNAQTIANSSHSSFYLKASVQTLADRLFAEREKRPLIKDLEDTKLQEFIAKHLFERAPFYQKAHHTIVIDTLCVDAIVAQIQAKL